MRTLIISGGDIEAGFALKIMREKFDQIIGVDRGVKFCSEQGIVPTDIVGDFDSLDDGILDSYKNDPLIRIRKFSPEKDATDTQIAVESALAFGSSRIIILGATGNRLDHVLGNIQCMSLALKKGVDCEIVDPHNRIRLIQRRCIIRREEQYGKYISLLPLTTEVTGVTLRGVKYPLTDYRLTVLESAGLGVSNEITEEQAEITAEDGILIMIESKD